MEIDYFDALKDLDAQAASSNANLVLMGIEPTYPSEKYGYIIPDTPAPVSTVSMQNSIFPRVLFGTAVFLLSVLVMFWIALMH